MINKPFLIIIFLLLLNKSCLTQSIKVLSIGDTVPAEIWNTLIKKEGKELVILDFWSTWCSTCMASFPKMEKLNSQFDSQLQIILVNSYEDEQTIKKRLDKINKNRTTEKQIKIPNLLSISGDTILKKLFPHSSVPHHVWVNSDGKVLAITSGYNATVEHVQSTLNGEKVNLSRKDDLINFHTRKEGLMKTRHPSLPSPQFLSAFLPYFSGIGSGTNRAVDSTAGTLRITWRNYSITRLYQTAFKVLERRMMVDVINPIDFDSPIDNNLKDEWYERNLFTYEIVIPLKDEEKVFEYMQSDLNRFFTSKIGIEGSIEKRKIQGLILVKIKDGLLNNNTMDKKFSKEEDTLIIQNYSFRHITRLLFNELEDMKIPVVFFDESAIDPKLKVNIQLIGNLKNIALLRKQLWKYGLDIIKTEREVEVLIIKNL